MPLPRPPRSRVRATLAALRPFWITGALLVAGCKDKTIVFDDAGPPPVDAPADAGLDAPPPIDAAVGQPGQATVAGAVKASSASYRLYGTLRSGAGSSASPSYQRRGGVTGATQ